MLLVYCATLHVGVCVCVCGALSPPWKRGGRGGGGETAVGKTLAISMDGRTSETRRHGGRSELSVGTFVGPWAFSAKGVRAPVWVVGGDSGTFENSVERNVFLRIKKKYDKIGELFSSGLKVKEILEKLLHLYTIFFF